MLGPAALLLCCQSETGTSVHEEFETANCNGQPPVFEIRHLQSRFTKFGHCHYMSVHKVLGFDETIYEATRLGAITCRGVMAKYLEFRASVETLEWYHWNRENVSILLLIHVMAGTQVKMPLTTFISLNYTLFKQVIKLTYSVNLRYLPLNSLKRHLQVSWACRQSVGQIREIPKEAAKNNETKIMPEQQFGSRQKHGTMEQDGQSFCDISSQKCYALRVNQIIHCPWEIISDKGFHFLLARDWRILNHWESARNSIVESLQDWGKRHLQVSWACRQSVGQIREIPKEAAKNNETKIMPEQQFGSRQKHGTMEQDGQSFCDISSQKCYALRVNQIIHCPWEIISDKGFHFLLARDWRILNHWESARNSIVESLQDWGKVFCYMKENMVLEIHHDRYGHKYYTYPEHSKMYYDYGLRGSHLFYEPNRTRWHYNCYWPQEALNFATAEDKRRRMVVRKPWLRSRMRDATFIRNVLSTFWSNFYANIELPLLFYMNTNKKSYENNGSRSKPNVLKNLESHIPLMYFYYNSASVQVCKTITYESFRPLKSSVLKV
ncbi:hypothetical protein HUJ04_009882 [Dendroctonus ponderosae]|nr:hypothetical protein HUJ04_009882 [Dendroctonus ponderosae]